MAKNKLLNLSFYIVEKEETILTFIQNDNQDRAFELSVPNKFLKSMGSLLFHLSKTLPNIESESEVQISVNEQYISNLPKSKTYI